MIRVLLADDELEDVGGEHVEVAADHLGDAEVADRVGEDPPEAGVFIYEEDPLSHPETFAWWHTTILTLRGVAQKRCSVSRLSEKGSGQQSGPPTHPSARRRLGKGEARFGSALGGGP